MILNIIGYTYVKEKGIDLGRCGSIGWGLSRALGVHWFDFQSRTQAQDPGLILGGGCAGGS